MPATLNAGPVLPSLPAAVRVAWPLAGARLFNCAHTQLRTSKQTVMMIPTRGTTTCFTSHSLMAKPVLYGIASIHIRGTHMTTLDAAAERGGQRSPY